MHEEIERGGGERKTQINNEKTTVFKHTCSSADECIPCGLCLCIEKHCFERSYHSFMCVLVHRKFDILAMPLPLSPLADLIVFFSLFSLHLLTGRRVRRPQQTWFDCGFASIGICVNGANVRTPANAHTRALACLYRVCVFISTLYTFLSFRAKWSFRKRGQQRRKMESSHGEDTINIIRMVKIGENGAQMRLGAGF